MLVGGGDAAGRLVEQDHLGREREGAGDVEQLLLALRQQARRRRSLRSRPKIAGDVAHARRIAASSGSDAKSRQLLPGCETTATAIVSATVSAGKMCTSWKARAMPRLASTTGPMPAMFSPLKRTTPSVGFSSPVSTLTSVVLPAPFGPDDRDQLALGDRERDVVERDEIAVGLAHARGFDQRCRHAGVPHACAGQLQPGAQVAGNPAGRAGRR